MPDPVATAAAEPGPTDVSSPALSAREQRLRGKGVEDEDEDEEAGGVGALPGAGIARAEGFMVQDAPGADAPHSNDTLGQEADGL